MRSLALVMVIGLVAFRDKGKGRGEAGPFTRVLYDIEKEYRNRFNKKGSNYMDLILVWEVG